MCNYHSCMCLCTKCCFFSRHNSENIYFNIDTKSFIFILRNGNWEASSFFIQLFVLPNKWYSYCQWLLWIISQGLNKISTPNVFESTKRKKYIYTKIYPTSLSLDSRSVYIYCRLQDVFDKLVPAWYPSHQIIEKSIF